MYVLLESSQISFYIFKYFTSKEDTSFQIYALSYKLYHKARFPKLFRQITKNQEIDIRYFSFAMYKS